MENNLVIIQSLAQQYYPKIVAIRHQLHMYPEIGFEEFETAKTVMQFLDSVNIPYQSGIAKTGIVATIVGHKPGKTVLLRADMDALAMSEDPNNPIVSKIANRMHACGHDGHTAGLCLAGAILNEMKDQISGTIKLMFQPAEETDGGAYPMIEAGVLDGVDAAFGCHLWGSALENTVLVKHGAMMAAPDAFEIKVIGKGGHGAMPHLSVDPILIASYIVSQTQSVVSRLSNPLEPIVVSFGSIHGGSAFNVIPNEVVLTGTIRTLSVENRQRVHQQIHKIAQATAEGLGGTIEFKYQPKYPVLINDDAMTDLAAQSFSKIVGESQVLQLKDPSMGGEDFAYIAQNVPAAFIYVGIAKDLAQPVLHHHPQFSWDDQNMLILGKGLAQCALDFLSHE